MVSIALKMLLDNKSRSVSTVVGIAVAFFLSSAQMGLLVGWCNTCSAILRNAGVYVWIMAPHTPALEYGTGIPGHSPESVRDGITAGVPGIEALTTSEFIVRTIKYWMLETGIGITVVVTAVLGLIVGMVIFSHFRKQHDRFATREDGTARGTRNPKSQAVAREELPDLPVIELERPALKV